MVAATEIFVHAYLLDGAGGGRALDTNEVYAWRPADGLLWVHLDVLNPSARKWMAENSGLDELLTDAMLAGDTRPRSISENDGVLIILRGVNTNPGADPQDMVSVRVWIEKDRIVSTRRRLLLSVQDVREAIDRGLGPKTPGQFLVMLAERLAFRIGVVVGDIEDKIDSIEDRAEIDNIRDLQKEIGILRRQTAQIRRYLAPQREALIRVRGRTEVLAPSEIYELEEHSDLTTRYLEDLDLAREQAILTQEQLANRLANEQNARLYVLSIVAAIFLPLSFVTGLLGMNVGGLPGIDYAPAFAISVLTMAGLAAGLIVLFKRKKWI